MLLRFIILGLSCAFFITACKHKYPVPVKNFTAIDTTTYGGYPDEVGKIFHSKCVDGCHDAVAQQSELRMDTWDNLFYGGAHGASVVPYSTAYSLLLHYINTDPAKGPVAKPGMPYELPPLSDEEYKTIKEWIANGAPDRNGTIAFSENPGSRQKIYVTQQCSQLAVIDAERMVVMRYIPIGKTPGLDDNPHCVRVTEDGMYAYVGFTGGSYLQKIDTRIDKVVDEVPLGEPGWEILLPAPDNSAMLLSNPTRGKVMHLDLTTKITKPYTKSNPHGLTVLPGFDKVFVTCQTGNTINKFSVSDPFVNKDYTLDGKPTNINLSAYDPHEIILSPDNDRLFITCQGADSLAVADTAMNILKMIGLGDYPQELAISKKHNYLFVSCMNEISSRATAQVELKGTVYVFNYKTLEQVAKIDPGFMDAHAISVDDRNDRLYIFSRNIGAKGPAPHHIFGCGTTPNGFFHVYNMTDLSKPLQGKRELLPNPYSADVRFK